jgi:nucleotide-binding universal stress UspA family protein
VIKIEKILVGFAFSPNLKANVFEALRMASFFNGELLFFHVGTKTPEKVSRFMDLIKSCPVQPKKISVRWEIGNPVSVLLKASEAFKAELIILGALKKRKCSKILHGFDR